MSPNIHDYVEDELLRLAMEQIDGVAITNEEGRYVYVNQSWSDLMGGIPLEQVQGRTVKELFPETKLDEVLATGKAAVFGEVTRLKDGGKAYGTWYPIIRDGKTRGAFFHIILRDMMEARSLVADIQRLNQQLEYYKQELSRVQGAKYSLSNIVGESPAIKALRQNLLNISRSSSTVLITGETGCGKELVAHTIHSLSLRQTAPFVKVNCAAIPPELMESEFFGYEPGSFTGASRKGSLGKFEVANQGSLFLDEINHLPMHLQPKLLRVLQEREIERVGGSESIPVDVRIIAATNVSLERMIEENQFRQDLYYRLNVLTIHVPPLRDRLSDIPILCDHLLERLNRQMGMEIPSVTDEVKEHFMDYSWPGNIRELQNVLERGMNNAWREPVSWEHVKEYFFQPRSAAPLADKQELSIRNFRKTNERIYIREVIAQCNGNKKKAAEKLGMSRSMLYRKLAETRS